MHTNCAVEWRRAGIMICPHGCVTRQVVRPVAWKKYDWPVDGSFVSFHPGGRRSFAEG